MGLFSKKSSDAPPAPIERVLTRADLPSFPRAAQGALDAIRQPSSKPGDIASAIEKDPKLTVTVLKTVNSAGYGLRRAVDSVAHATVMMGRAPLESLLLGVVVASLVPVPKTRALSPERFWQAAARRATAAKRLARLTAPELADQAFTAALLQDLAVPVLAVSEGASYDTLLETWRGTATADLAHLEHDALGHSHAEVAYWAGKHWGLPPSLVDALKGHHHDDGTKSPVHLVSVLKDHEDALPATLVDHVTRVSGLSSTQVQATVEDAWREADEIAHLFMR